MKLLVLLFALCAAATEVEEAKEADKGVVDRIQLVRDKFMPVEPPSEEMKTKLTDAVAKCKAGPLKDKPTDQTVLDNLKTKIENVEYVATPAEVKQMAGLVRLCVGTEANPEMEPLRGAGRMMGKKASQQALGPNGLLVKEKIPDLTDPDIQTMMRPPPPKNGKRPVKDLMMVDEEGRQAAMMGLSRNPDNLFKMNNIMAKRLVGKPKKDSFLDMDKIRIKFSGSLPAEMDNGVDVSVVATDVSELEVDGADTICGKVLTVDFQPPGGVDVLRVKDLPEDDAIWICNDVDDKCPIFEGRDPMTIKDGKFVKAEGVVAKFDEKLNKNCFQTTHLSTFAISDSGAFSGTASLPVMLAAALVAVLFNIH